MFVHDCMLLGVFFTQHWLHSCCLFRIWRFTVLKLPLLSPHILLYIVYIYIFLCTLIGIQMHKLCLLTCQPALLVLSVSNIFSQWHKGTRRYKVAKLTGLLPGSITSVFNSQADIKIHLNWSKTSHAQGKWSWWLSGANVGMMDDTLHML